MEGPRAQIRAQAGVFMGHPTPRCEPGAVPSHLAAASERLLLWSLAKMRLMWFLTVFSLMKQAAAICWLVMPDAMRFMISASLALSWKRDRSEDDCPTDGCSCESALSDIPGW